MPTIDEDVPETSVEPKQSGTERALRASTTADIRPPHRGEPPTQPPTVPEMPDHTVKEQPAYVPPVNDETTRRTKLAVDDGGPTDPRPPPVKLMKPAAAPPAKPRYAAPMPELQPYAPVKRRMHPLIPLGILLTALALVLLLVNWFVAPVKPVEKNTVDPGTKMKKMFEW